MFRSFKKDLKSNGLQFHGAVTGSIVEYATEYAMNIPLSLYTRMHGGFSFWRLVAFAISRLRHSWTNFIASNQYSIALCTR